MIEFEEHILPSEVRDAWAAAPPPYDPVSAFADGSEDGIRLADLSEGRLALMDEQGVDVQVPSLTTPGLHNLAPGSAVDAARRVYDLIADACARHPERFQGLAALRHQPGVTPPWRLVEERSPTGRRKGSRCATRSAPSCDHRRSVRATIQR